MSAILQVLTLLTGILFCLSLSAGIYGFNWGARLGQEALVGIKQPDSSGSSVFRGEGKPSSSPAPDPNTISPPPFLLETDIIKRVKDQMGTPQATPSVSNPNGKGNPSNNPSNNPNGSPSPSPSSSPKGTVAFAPGFPYSTQSEGVALDVLGVEADGGQSLTLKVSIKNEGTQTVRFLYSFLTVTDNQGQALGSSVEGLPSELPALSGSFTGEIQIPRVNREGLKTINVSLADYPDQTVKLNIEGIPVPPKN
jgi:hypothetical protein